MSDDSIYVSCLLSQDPSASSINPRTERGRETDRAGDKKEREIHLDAEVYSSYRSSEKRDKIGIFVRHPVFFEAVGGKIIDRETVCVLHYRCTVYMCTNIVL